MNGELKLTTMVEMGEGRRPKDEEGLFPQLLARLQELQLREIVSGQQKDPKPFTFLGRTSAEHLADERPLRYGRTSVLFSFCWTSVLNLGRASTSFWTSVLMCVQDERPLLCLTERSLLLLKMSVRICFWTSVLYVCRTSVLSVFGTNVLHELLGERSLNSLDERLPSWRDERLGWTSVQPGLDERPLQCAHWTNVRLLATSLRSLALYLVQLYNFLETLPSSFLATK
ncbi:hypothetical protein LR48_Vigan10g042000 [Vigna angularis]|uniref:Uncharacterized protein n=1 Tax=Phaseolus angularis TaxID=3914 RepID=A0A0L9VHS1_PHAAN|nr:hypothetical protein LR48_Vigan10g042000 [Vigna angularis]